MLTADHLAELLSGIASRGTGLRGEGGRLCSRMACSLVDLRSSWTFLSAKFWTGTRTSGLFSALLH